ncbi:MAG: insulinase family protein [Firmicutes bacterium]|nr:insulinase family protein [Bacillota bacterium]
MQKTILENGIRIVTEFIPYVRSATVGFWLKVGSQDEADGQLGISHMIEHMMFKGTMSRSAREIAETIDATGGQLNAYTEKEYTSYYGKVPDEHFDLLIEVLADMLLNSVFAQQELEKEKGVILEEIRMYEDSPEDLVHEGLLESLLKPHPVSRGILGTKETVGFFQREDLLAYYAQHYVPSNLVVSVVGNVEHRQVVDSIARHFSRWKGQEPQKQRNFRPQGGGQFFKIKDTEQAHICLGVPGFSRKDEDKYALQVLDTALGGGMSSRLFQSLREDRGLVYSTFSYHTCYEDVGTVAVYAGTSPSNTSQVIRLIREECRRVVREGLRPEELKRAKEQLKGSILLELESMGARMGRLAKAELYNERLLTPQEVIAKIDAVGLEDIRRVAHRLFAEKPFALAVVGPVSRGRLIEEAAFETA